MVGQVRILNYIDSLNTKNIPSFLILLGGKGSGRTMLAKHFANSIDATFTTCGIKVDEIRSIIDTAYKTREKVVYCIQDADTMRNEAKNAMLKITEEPPKNAYFVMTVENDSTLLDTIKSRAMVLSLDPYTKKELEQYFYSTTNEGGSEIKLISDIATTPYEVDKMIEYGKDFIDYVNLVIDNIANVEPANAFKAGGRIALKNEEDKYDFKLFLNAFIELCINRIYEDTKNSYHYSKGIDVTIPYLNKVSHIGVNKQQLYDAWVFEIRGVWQ